MLAASDEEPWEAAMEVMQAIVQANPSKGQKDLERLILPIYAAFDWPEGACEYHPVFSLEPARKARQ